VWQPRQKEKGWGEKTEGPSLGRWWRKLEGGSRRDLRGVGVDVGRGECSER